MLVQEQTNAACVSTDEQRRASSIAKPQRRRQFIAGRMLLRRMLADSLGGRAEDFELEATAGAPPRVVAHPGLHLSVSHSGEWVVAAVADRPVGIDIERLGERRDPQRFARWVCSADEWTDWRMLDGAAADDALIAHWTRKEAWLKREGGEVLLTRMHRLHAGTADAASADGATWRVADAAMLSVCADAVADLRIDAKTLQLLRPPAHWRMTASAA
ncbi:MAG TPA: 4'-phosphopantetheinyl transferase superfamily protein [Pseudomonadota bacterium]|nr:4'-phosphopantetheinyl transferase superfamily protein [Pseudomonadota bacterium]